MTILLALLIGCETPIPPDQARYTPTTPPPLPSTTKVEEIFIQAGTSTDFLFAIDDTCGADRSVFLDHWFDFRDALDASRTDYRVGVITLDMVDPARSGKLVEADGYRWIDPLTPPAAHWDTGDCSTAPAAARDAIFEALEMSDNADFLREGIALNVILQAGSLDASQLGKSEFDAWLDTLDAAQFTLIDADADLATFVGAVPFQANANREFFLSNLPYRTTIEISVRHEGVIFAFEEADWYYRPRRNSVTFHEFVPAPGSMTYARYETVRW